MKIVKSLLLAVAACASALNCTGAKTETVNTNAAAAANAAVVVNSNTINTNQAVAAADSKQTTTASPDALIKDLYKENGKEDPFFETKNRAVVDKYFEKNLAELIWKGNKHPDGEMGPLEANPYYDAQDEDIKNFAIGQPKINGDKAQVVVSFTNFGQKRAITYDLVRENGAWKIYDVKYDQNRTLLGMYKRYFASANESGKKGEFEGTYQIGDTTCTVKPIKMAFEVKWAKGSGSETFFSEGKANDKFIFASQPETGKANVFSFDDENYNSGIFYRADGKEFPIKRAK